MAQVDMEWLEGICKKYLKDSRFKIGFIAQQLLISPRQFHRRLKSLTGLSPNQYFQELRLQIAYDYLVQGQFSTVKEVCFAVGYGNVRDFSKLFIQRFGARPSALER